MSSIDAQHVIDEAPFGARHYLLYFVLFLCLAVDGLDTQVSSYLSHVIANEWKISMASVGTMFSMGLAGTAIGALTLGALGDALGNRRIIVVATFVIGLATMGMAHTSSIEQLVALRFVTGLGVGGSLPNLIALASQYAPKRSRATLITMISCGFPAGATLAGLITNALADSHGWRVTYFVAGLLPLLLAPAILALAPESFAAIVRKRDGQTRLIATLRRLYPRQLTDGTNVHWHAPRKRAKLPLMEIFQHGWGIYSALLSGIFFLSLMNVYFLSNWLPGLLSQLHSTPRQAIQATIGFNLGGMVGALLLGRLIDRFGFARVLCISLVASSAFMFMLAQTRFSDSVLYAMAFSAGFVVLGGQGGLNVLPALIFPEHLRATASGWAIGTGRLGSVIGPLSAGMLLSGHWTSVEVLSLAAIVPVLAASLIGVLAMRLVRKPPSSLPIKEEYA